MNRLSRLDSLIDQAREHHTSALCVTRGGEVLIDEVLDGGGDRPIETMSVTKAVLSLLVGRAVTLGQLPGAEVRVSEFFPEWRQGRKWEITLRHLLTHTSGLQNAPLAPAEIYPAPDFVQLALCAELVSEPGRLFEYNNKAANLICGLLQRATGQKADDFAREHLFGPLGIEEWSWVHDSAGNPHGMSGLSLRARDLARLGQLLLNDGDGLITPEWLRESTSPATPVFPRIGCLWWLWHSSLSFKVTPEHVDLLRQAGASSEVLAKVTQLIGLHERKEFGARLRQLELSPFRLPTGVSWTQEIPGPCCGVMHDGHLGQYLLVHEAAGLVAVRQIAWDHPEAHHPASGWPEFPDRVLRLLAV